MKKKSVLIVDVFLLCLTATAARITIVIGAGMVCTTVTSLIHLLLVMVRIDMGKRLFTISIQTTKLVGQ